MEDKEDGYIYHEFLDKKKTSSVHYKTWVCMGEVIVSDSKPDTRYYNHQPLGNNRYLRYSTYHYTKLNNIKADEKEQKQGYIELESVKSVIHQNSSCFWKAYLTVSSQEYSSSLSKEQLKRLKPYYVQVEFTSMSQLCGSCPSSPNEEASVSLFPILSPPFEKDNYYVLDKTVKVDSSKTQRFVCLGTIIDTNERFLEFTYEPLGNGKYLKYSEYDKFALHSKIEPELERVMELFGNRFTKALSSLTQGMKVYYVEMEFGVPSNKIAGIRILPITQSNKEGKIIDLSEPDSSFISKGTISQDVLHHHVFGKSENITWESVEDEPSEYFVCIGDERNINPSLACFPTIVYEYLSIGDNELRLQFVPGNKARVPKLQPNNVVEFHKSSSDTPKDTHRDPFTAANYE